MPCTSSGKYAEPSDQLISATIASHQGLTPTGIPAMRPMRKLRPGMTATLGAASRVLIGDRPASARGDYAASGPSHRSKTRVSLDGRSPRPLPARGDRQGLSL